MASFEPFPSKLNSFVDLPHKLKVREKKAPTLNFLETSNVGLFSLKDLDTSLSTLP